MADAWALAGRDRALLAAARASGRGRLHVWAAPGDLVALGRYHPVPPRVPRGERILYRRLSGGRVMPVGAGYLGLTLALPHRAALIGEDPNALAPEQILNRAVRGVLGTLEAFGIAGHYPGRDLVTVEGRIVGAMGFEVDASGATLVETSLAVGRTFAELAGFVDRVDREGVVPIDMILPDQATSIAGAAGREPPFDELVDRIGAGYRERLGIDVVTADGPLPAAEPDLDWVAAGVMPTHLDRHASLRTMLGVLAAHVALSADGTIAAARLSGDFIASSVTIERIERGLAGARPERASLAPLVERLASGPGDFVLGVGPLSTIADVVSAACEASP